MEKFYEVRGTPVETGIPVMHSMRKRVNAIKKAQAMVMSNKFYYITVRKAGQFVVDFNGGQELLDM